MLLCSPQNVLPDPGRDAGKSRNPSANVLCFSPMINPGTFASVCRRVDKSSMLPWSEVIRIKSLVHVPCLDQPFQHAIEDFHLLDGPLHVLFVTGVIAGPIFEHGKIVRL